MKHLYQAQPERQITNQLSPQDVGFITALAQDVTVTEKNIAALESGFFSAKKSAPLYSMREQALLDAGLVKSIPIYDRVLNKKAKHLIELEASTQAFKLANSKAQSQREAQGEALKRLGSSKGAKVGHGKHKHIDRLITRSRRMPPRHKTESFCGDNVTDEYRERPESQSGWIVNENKRLEWEPIGKSRAYLMERNWANQVKMQVKFHPSPSDAPAPQSGERFSEKLTSRSVKKIFEAGAYVAACHGGFSTFLTLTFTPEQRERIFGGEAVTDEGLRYCPIRTTIGAEVSRFMNGLKKMYQRGFEYSAKATDQLALEGEKVKIDGRIGRPLKAVWKDDDDIRHEKEIHGPTKKPFDFHYIWVAESPANEDGEPNPHVHVLLNWRIEPHHFAGWAQRIEQLWGNGMAHLEKIKFSEAAAGYLIKAVGYAAKGDNADQGLIKGNRYNIARCSRAPDWDVISSFDVDNMTGIIKECGYRLEQWRKPMQREIRRKETKKAEAIRAIDINRKKGKFDAVQKLNHLIKKLDAEAREIRNRLKSRGTFASSLNQFSIVFEGEEHRHKAGLFLLWACGARGWSMKASHERKGNDFDLLRDDARWMFEYEYERFQLNQANWKNQLNQEVPPEPDYQIIKSDSMATYHDYCQHIH